MWRGRLLRTIWPCFALLPTSITYTFHGLVHSFTGDFTLKPCVHHRSSRRNAIFHAATTLGLLHGAYGSTVCPCPMTKSPVVLTHWSYCFHVLRLFQIRRVWFFRFIVFIMCLDTVYIYVHSKISKLGKAKTSYRLERGSSKTSFFLPLNYVSPDSDFRYEILKLNIFDNQTIKTGSLCRLTSFKRMILFIYLFSKNDWLFHVLNNLFYIKAYTISTQFLIKMHSIYGWYI